MQPPSCLDPTGALWCVVCCTVLHHPVLWCTDMVCNLVYLHCIWRVLLHCFFAMFYSLYILHLPLVKICAYICCACIIFYIFVIFSILASDFVFYSY